MTKTITFQITLDELKANISSLTEKDLAAYFACSNCQEHAKQAKEFFFSGLERWAHSRNMTILALKLFKDKQK